MGRFEEQLFCEASQENHHHNARAQILRPEGIEIPGSKEASFFRRFYSISCGFSPFVWERGLVYYCLLENRGATASISVSAFRMRDPYREKSYNVFQI